VSKSETEFHEEDEPVEDVVRAFGKGQHLLTAPPPKDDIQCPVCHAGPGRRCYEVGRYPHQAEREHPARDIMRRQFMMLRNLQD
jgi:hypothetical protein